MRGSTLVISNTNYKSENLVTSDYIKEDNLLVYKKFNNKFNKEKIFENGQKLIVVLDGVILNDKELNLEFNAKDKYTLIEKLYTKYGINFADKLRGNYYGIVYDKRTKECHVFTNHLGNKPVYHYFNKDNGTLVISSDLFDLIKVLKELNIKTSLDELGAYYLLTFGYMLLDTTLIKEIKKIEPGTIVSYKDGKLTKEQYYFLDNENYLTDSEDKIIDNMYELFNSSIKQSFDKDIENGYKHISYLSGGLDSRIIGVGAKALGYDNITTLTFAENNSRDEKIAREIAADMNFENIFKSLNNGNFLKNIEKTVDANYGQIIYSGAAHLLDATNSINLNDYGFLHNGNLADVMHGDYIEGKAHTKPSLSNWAYSSKLLDKVSFVQDEIRNKYGNEERFAIYNRGINAIYNGSISMLDKMETCEPFTHQDAVAYCSRMEPKYKYKEGLFLKMIQKHYPEATNYKWQKWNLKPTAFNTKFMSTFPGKVFRVLDGKIQMHLNQSNNMNPFNKWYNENETLRTFINEYLKENLNRLDGYNELKKDCEVICKIGNIVEKTQVMTLIQFLKRIDKI